MKPPVIIEQPEDLAVMHGEDIIISVKARGPNLSYHWWMKKLSSNKPHKLEKTLNVFEDVDKPHLSIKSVSDNEIGQYSCKISNLGGEVKSKKATLLFKAKIDCSPKQQKVEEGKEVRLKIEASGTELKYQWSKDGQPLLSDDTNFKGASTDELIIKKATPNLAGCYLCTVSNACSKDVSLSASVDVGKYNINLYEQTETNAQALLASSPGCFFSCTTGRKGET